MAKISTDKSDYAPGETVAITLTDFDPGMLFNFSIQEWADDPGDDNVVNSYTFSVTDGGESDLDPVAGQIITHWVVPDDGSALNATFDLTATSASGDVTEPATFTNSAGSYTIKWYAADPELNKAPFLPTYEKLTPAEYLASHGGVYPTGSATDPLPNAQAYASPAIPSNLDAVTSLQPKSLELGQIVPFFIEITVNGSTTPENGIITTTPEWLAKTTNGGNFGFDPSYGVLAAFVDKGDPQYTDTGTAASVTGINTTILGTGGSNERIHSGITVSGLDNGDKTIVEAWVVLKSTIPTVISGNVQTALIDATTGAVAGAGSKTSLGNQTVPLSQVGEFFSSNADLSVIKSDSTDASTNALHLMASPDVDPANLQPGQTFTYTVLAKNNSTDTVANTVVVTDTLGLNVTFVSASNSGVFADNGAAADTVTWSIGALSPGQSQLLTVTVKVNDTAPTSSATQDLLNSVSISSITTDTITDNNTNTEPTNLIRAGADELPPVIDIVKTGPATVMEGARM